MRELVCDGCIGEPFPFTSKPRKETVISANNPGGFVTIAPLS